jgi:hypothetical protein
MTNCSFVKLFVLFVYHNKQMVLHTTLCVITYNVVCKIKNVMCNNERLNRLSVLADWDPLQIFSFFKPLRSIWQMN